MPLSDFFKRSPKKESAQTQQTASVKPSAQDESLLSPEMQKKRYDAAFDYHCKTAKDIDPFVATGIVAMGVVEGARTAPPPRKPKGAKQDSTTRSKPQEDKLLPLIASIAQNSTDGVGNRLVIGEGTTAMGEALRNGGRYILVHPEILHQLKTNSVDAFLIYAAAMRMETASMIPQIDFVGARVDQLVQEWSGKPEGQAPMHVRQALWLLNNAANLGYERRGDSWVLKS